MNYFISDLHFGLQDRESERYKETLLVEFLKSVTGKARTLVILGDLYDYWFEYKHVYQKGYFRTLTALADLKESGTEIYYIIGNHDFLHRDFFEKEIGAELIHEDLVKEIECKKFFLSHGDSYVANDTGYKILKKILRNRFLQKIYSMVHPDIGISIAGKSSRKSRNYTAHKSYGESDSLRESAQKLIDERGYDFVIFGHSHRRAFEKYKESHYINLGSWIEQPCYGKYENGSFEIINLDQK